MCFYLSNIALLKVCALDFQAIPLLSFSKKSWVGDSLLESRFDDSTVSNESSKTARPKTRSRHPNPTTDKRKSAFHRQSSIFLSMLVDWDIPFDQLDMDESKPLSGGRFGTKCYIGKWHGECNIR